MTRANPIVSAVKSKLSSSKTVSRSHPLRSQSSKSVLYVTPSKLSPVKLSDRKPVSSPTPLTPSKIQCIVRVLSVYCQGIQGIVRVLSEYCQGIQGIVRVFRVLSVY